jgi:hypothetical protein
VRQRRPARRSSDARLAVDLRAALLDAGLAGVVVVAGGGAEHGEEDRENAHVTVLANGREGVDTGYLRRDLRHAADFRGPRLGRRRLRVQRFS